MSGRIEYKYLVPNELMGELRAQILPYLRLDPPPGGGNRADYTVRSVYYDTPRFECYDGKADGLRMRNKFRIRGYGCGENRSVVFLEIKRKCESFIRKHRAPLAHDDVQAFLASRDVDRYIQCKSGSSREKEDELRFLYHYGRHGLRPTVLVVYEREAFAGKFDQSLRVTFDKNVRGSAFPTLEQLYDDSQLVFALPGRFIFEVKFFRYALPAWVRSIVRQYELPRMALSKYAMCLDVSAAERPSWTLQRRHFLLARGLA